MLESRLEFVTEVKQRIESVARISLFMDFDGTLVPERTRKRAASYQVANDLVKARAHSTINT